jgi:tetratricopeptide (TPR) repeat protein
LIHRAIGDRRYEGQSLVILGTTSGMQGEYDRAKRYYEQALSIQEEIGERRGQVITYTNLGRVARLTGNYAEALAYYEQALPIAQKAGIRHAEGVLHANQGGIFFQLGVYDRAAAAFEREVALGHALGDQEAISDGMAGLGLLSHRLGDDRKAREYSEGALQIAQDLNDAFLLGPAWTFLGHALAGLGELENAVQAYRRAVSTQVEIDQHNEAAEARAGLVLVHLRQGALEQALDEVNKILARMEASPALEGAEEPLWVYWTCYRVLEAGKDPRARSVLEAAHHLLMERAGQIDETALRRSFLENVAAHQEIVQEYLTSDEDSE